MWTGVKGGSGGCQLLKISPSLKGTEVMHCVLVDRLSEAWIMVGRCMGGGEKESYPEHGVGESDIRTEGDLTRLS